MRILGPVEVRADGRPLPLAGPQQVSLLACMAVYANQPVSCDRLIELLWGANSAGGRHRLQMAVARLRQAMAPAVKEGRVTLRTVHGGYLLSVGDGDIDAALFAALVREGQRALQANETSRARELLRRGLMLWRGPALAEVGYHDFAQTEIRRLEELRLTGLEAKFEAELRLGRHLEIVSELAALFVEHSTREHLALQLMLALYRCGRQADALTVYQRVHTHLASELGLDPAPSLKSLQHRILNHDPLLHASICWDDSSPTEVRSRARIRPKP